MKNILYEKTIVEARKSPDGETPTCIYVTEEANCFIIWFYGYDKDQIFEKNRFILPLQRIIGYENLDRNKALEMAIDIGRMPLDEIINLIK